MTYEFHTAHTPNTSARSGSPKYLIIHRMQGGYDGTVAYFQTSAAQVSADECVKRDGSAITQFNPPGSKLKTWQVGNANSLCVGFEIEGYVGDDATLPDQLFDTLADRLIHHQAGIKKVYGVTIPLKRTTTKDAPGICGHVDVARWYGGSDHTDPGPGFRYDRLDAAIKRRLDPPKPDPQPKPAPATEALEVIQAGKVVRHIEYGDGRVGHFFEVGLGPLLDHGPVTLIRHKIGGTK